MEKTIKIIFIFIGVFFFLIVHWVSMWPVLVLLISIVLITRIYLSRKNIPDIVLLICSIGISLSLGEIVFRLRNNYSEYGESGRGIIERMVHTNYTSPFGDDNMGPCHTFQPNSNLSYSTSEFTQHRVTNSVGLNDVEWSHKKKKYRIACVGDSFTEGFGATRDSTFEKILESITDAEVMNCGVSGSDPFFEYMLLKEKILRAYKPDMVLVAINKSDLYDVITRGGFERFHGNGGGGKLKEGPWWEGIYGVSFLFRSLVRDVFHLNQNFLNPEELKYEERKTIENIEGCIDRFQNMAQENGIQCIFLFHPTKDEVINRELGTAAVLEYAQRKHYRVINVLDAFIEQGINNKNINQYFWPLDGHNKNQGYRVIAQKIKADLDI